LQEGAVATPRVHRPPHRRGKVIVRTALRQLEDAGTQDRQQPAPAQRLGEPQPVDLRDQALGLLVHRPPAVCRAGAEQNEPPFGTQARHRVSFACSRHARRPWSQATPPSPGPSRI